MWTRSQTWEDVMTRAIGLFTVMLLPQLGLAEEKAAAPKAEAAKAEPMKMEAPKPAAELDALKPLAGMWNCDGKAPDSPMGPAHAYKASMNNKWDLGNF